MLSVLLLLSACLLPTTPDSGAPGDDTSPADADGDGYTASEDCDDDDATVHPGAEELCDDVDQDCDEAVDEGLEQTWYVDLDSDGYGGDSDTVVACSQPASYVAEAGDCDDDSAEINPGAEELCNGIDDDCDADVDFDIHALSFGEATDRVIIPDSDALDMGAEGTIELWILVAGVHEQEYAGGLFGKYALGQEDKTLTVYFDDFANRRDERVGGRFLNERGYEIIETPRNLALDTWVHVAFSWDSAGYGVYVGGREEISGSGAFDPGDADGDLYLGSLSRPGDLFEEQPAFIGLMHDVRVSSVRRYSGDFTPENTLTVDDDTQALYSLREGEGDTVSDAVGGSSGVVEGPEWETVDCRPDL